MSEYVLRCDDIVKSYTQGREEIEILNGISLGLKRGETLAIVGASGCGKSTLLNILGTLDKPTSGSVEINGQDVSKLKDRQLARLRNKNVGFVYQFHHLLAEFSALENVAMPLLIAGWSARKARQAASNWLVKVGLGDRAAHKPGQLSGGERQRVAIARSLTANPACVLMDEPTGNLDPHTAQAVQELLWGLTKDEGTAFVLVTHDHQLAGQMQSAMELTDGKLEALGAFQ